MIIIEICADIKLINLYLTNSCKSYFSNKFFDLRIYSLMYIFVAKVKFLNGEHATQGNLKFLL